MLITLLVVLTFEYTCYLIEAATKAARIVFCLTNIPKLVSSIFQRVSITITYP